MVSALGLLITGSLAETPATTGSMQGVVFTRNADGSRAVVPGARVSVCGATTNETQADASGGDVSTNLPPGSYTGYRFNQFFNGPGRIFWGNSVLEF